MACYKRNRKKTWEIVDEDGKVVETFRTKGTANHFFEKIKNSFFGKKYKLRKIYYD